MFLFVGVVDKQYKMFSLKKHEKVERDYVILFALRGS